MPAAREQGPSSWPSMVIQWIAPHISKQRVGKTMGSRARAGEKFLKTVGGVAGEIGREKSAQILSPHGLPAATLENATAGRPDGYRVLIEGKPRLISLGPQPFDPMPSLASAAEGSFIIRKEDKHDRRPALL
ncbi:hypothetical protein ACI2KS_12215 [Pseudomonas sp. NPDC087358]|uniref:hypothetical protein n=1 Tax=Pseudomonas sp. NPDC087358 TaxID=3364439 RepID=UPI0038508982